jgi:hypothetical protein
MAFVQSPHRRDKTNPVSGFTFFLQGLSQFTDQGILLHGNK